MQRLDERGEGIMNGIFSRIPDPETFSKDAAARTGFWVVRNVDWAWCGI
jgi:hypothetical protein